MPLPAGAGTGIIIRSRIRSAYLAAERTPRGPVEGDDHSGRALRGCHHNGGSMEPKKGLTYSGSGVDIDSANVAKARIRELVRTTYNENVLSEIGLFGGLFRMAPGGMKEPVLVSSADGVGTKLKVAIETGVHDTVGFDLVSHCVNDILVQGAYPLFFLDYIATGKLDPSVIGHVVEGLVKGCRETGCVLIGGETAEMPDFYGPGDYDLAGFIVGVVDRQRLVDGTTVRPGDVVLALPADGLHTNGYSLARKLFFEHLGLGVNDRVEALGCTVGEELLKPHRNYLRSVKPLLEAGLVRGLAHITGGGLLENIPRILPENCAVSIREDSWPVLPVYRFMAEAGNIEKMEMFRVFNMGVGMVVLVRPEDVERAESLIRESGERVWQIGTVEEGAREVVIR